MAGLEDVKVGDVVAVVTRHWRGEHVARYEVEKRTPTLVHAARRVWYAKSGFERGAKGDRWSSKGRLEVWGEQHDLALARQAQESDCSAIEALIDDQLAIRRLTLDQIRRIKAIIEEPQP